MADKLVTVRISGGAYTTVAAAIAGELAINPNLVAMAGILYIRVRGTGFYEMGGFDVSGFTTSAQFYVHIVFEDTNRASTRRLTNGMVVLGHVNITSPFTRITGMQITNPDPFGGAIVWDAEGVVIDSCFCLIGDAGGGAGLICDQLSGAPARIINSIVFGVWRAIDFGNSEVNGHVFNCVAISPTANEGIRFRENRGQGRCVNTYSTGYTTTPDTTFTACRSLNGSAGTAVVPYSTTTFSNVTAGSENLALVSGSALIGIGVNMSADATYPFNWAITGATRTTWDIGAAYFPTSSVVTISGLLDSTLVLVGAIQLEKNISGTLDSGLNLIGNVQLEKNITGSLNSALALIGNVQLEKNITGSLNSALALIGNVQLIKNVSGSLNSTLNLVGNVQLEKNIAGTLNSAFGFVGDITVGAQPVVTIDGSLDVVLGLVGNVQIEKNISGDLDVVLGLVGNVQIEKRLSGRLDAEFTLVGDVSVNATPVVTIGGELNADLDLVGDVQLEKNIVGSIESTFTFSCSLQVEKSITGSLDSTLDFVGDVQLEKNIAGSLDSEFVLVGDVTVRQQPIVTISGELSNSLTFTGSINVAVSRKACFVATSYAYTKFTAKSEGISKFTERSYAYASFHG